MSTVLITGASKGIGRSLVAKYLTRPSTTVIAGVHNPSSPDATFLSSLPTGPDSRILIAKIDSRSDTDALEAVASLPTQGVDRLDLVIANAGIFDTAAFLPVAEKSSNARFILMGTITGVKDIPLQIAAYGASKAAANFFVRKIHYENEGIATLAVHPGSVKTTSGDHAAIAAGFPGAFVEIEDSVNAIFPKFDELTRENGSGEFWGFDGNPIPW